MVQLVIWHSLNYWSDVESFNGRMRDELFNKPVLWPRSSPQRHRRMG
ncbi:hypothetical protein C7476_10935 [Phyllobacterium bourgognense]|uniref:Uncharacterized protein n=1 Tax=Phyllobacterium bourgognense TaxID=314236 RepID=A0A368YNP6_9HYPH|nr:hypothetical protein C7476_10935 [Phyllobacterium bourgognense]